MRLLWRRCFFQFTKGRSGPPEPAATIITPAAPSQDRGEVERYHRTLPRLAGDLNSSAVRLDNRFYNGKAHSCSLDTIAVVLSPVELVEDERALQVINAKAAIGNARNQAIVFHCAADKYGRSRRRVLGGVLQQMLQAFGDPPRHLNKVLTHRVLLNAVWGGESVQQPEYLRVFINQLRKKIEPKETPRYILTDPWIGYRFQPAGEQPL